MSASEKVRALKLVLGSALAAPVKKEMSSAPGIAQGLERGKIVELTGSAKIEWLCQFLSAHEGYQALWLNTNSQILPSAIAQRNVSLNRIIFSQLSEGDLFKVARKALTSQLFQVVVLPNVFDEINAFKALQLFAERANCHLILLGKNKPHKAWPISTQLQINTCLKQAYTVEVIKQKSQTGDGDVL